MRRLLSFIFKSTRTKSQHASVAKDEKETETRLLAGAESTKEQTIMGLYSTLL